MFVTVVVVVTSRVTRARRDPTTKPTLDELLAALTRNGELASGTLDLASIARWLDYVDHSAYTTAEVRAMLARSRHLAIDGEAWRLVEPWP